MNFPNQMQNFDWLFLNFWNTFKEIFSNYFFLPNYAAIPKKFHRLQYNYIFWVDFSQIELQSLNNKEFVLSFHSQ